MISQTKWPRLDFLGLSVVVVDGGDEMVDSPSGGGGGAIKSESVTVFNQVRDLGFRPIASESRLADYSTGVNDAARIG